MKTNYLSQRTWMPPQQNTSKYPPLQPASASHSNALSERLAVHEAGALAGRDATHEAQEEKDVETEDLRTYEDEEPRKGKTFGRHGAWLIEDTLFLFFWGASKCKDCGILWNLVVGWLLACLLA